jgi:hypothetical protein
VVSGNKRDVAETRRQRRPDFDQILRSVNADQIDVTLEPSDQADKSACAATAVKNRALKRPLRKDPLKRTDDPITIVTKEKMSLSCCPWETEETLMIPISPDCP